MGMQRDPWKEHIDQEIDHFCVLGASFGKAYMEHGPRVNLFHGLFQNKFQAKENPFD